MFLAVGVDETSLLGLSACTLTPAPTRKAEAELYETDRLDERTSQSLLRSKLVWSDSEDRCEDKLGRAEGIWSQSL